MFSANILASLTLFCIMLLPTVLYQIYMFGHSDPKAPMKLIFAGYLGVLLVGRRPAGLGIVYFLPHGKPDHFRLSDICGFPDSFGCWTMGQQGAATTKGAILQYVSIVHHYDDFSRGVIDTSGLIYYASFIVFSLFLTVRSVDSMRWRRA